MKVLRIKLKQNKAHYRKEETIDNKMTYPLPQFSTIIGALHNICGYTEYHPMDISVQGTFENIGMEYKREITFFNSAQKDRGMLVKVANPDCLSSYSYTKVAECLKLGSDIIKGEMIKIYNPVLLEEYRNIVGTKNKELSNYFSIIYSPKYIEILYEVELIIHISAKEDTLKLIKENIYNLFSLGRSEDYVEVIDCDYVEIKPLEKDLKVKNLFYISKKHIAEGKVKTAGKGTAYKLSKNYIVIKEKRVFEEKDVVLLEDFTVSKNSIYFDGTYFVDLN